MHSITRAIGFIRRDCKSDADWYFIADFCGLLYSEPFYAITYPVSCHKQQNFVPKLLQSYFIIHLPFTISLDLSLHCTHTVGICGNKSHNFDAFEETVIPSGKTYDKYLYL